MNETLKTLNTRRSIRKYTDQPVPKEILDQILEAGSYAATGMGKQAPIIIAVTNKAVRDQLSNLNARVMGQEGKSDPFYGAPAVLVVLAKKEVGTYLYDGSLVMGNLMNAAAALGIGSCWIHRAKETFEYEEGKEILKGLGLDPEAYEGIGNLIVGYSAEGEKTAAPRKTDYIYYID